MSDASLETAARFEGLATIYDRYRPTYPPEAIAAVLAGLGPAPAVVDVGAGTGISARLLAAAGARVVAIEPGDDMRSVALASGVDARSGTASETGLAARCADAVTAFQAFHWFAHAAALAEFARLLRPGGRIALVWNERDTLDDDFTREIREIERCFSDGDPTAGMRFVDESLEPLLVANGFPRVRRLRFANEQRLDAQALVGRVRSTSYAPRSGPRLAEMLEALAAAHARFADAGGFVTFRYLTEVIVAEPPAP